MSVSTLGTMHAFRFCSKTGSAFQTAVFGPHVFPCADQFSGTFERRDPTSQTSRPCHSMDLKSRIPKSRTNTKTQKAFLFRKQAQQTDTASDNKGEIVAETESFLLLYHRI